jgi:hypothetical protein
MQTLAAARQTFRMQRCVDVRVIRYKIHAVENWMNFSAA